MLPSMPILFTRESQDAFGNKIEPSTSFFSQSLAPKREISVEIPSQSPKEVPKVQDEVKIKKEPEKKTRNDPPNNDNALEDALVKSYYNRVQTRFSTNASSPANKFIQFQTLLKEFDPYKETPVDLYRKVEQLFGKDSDITEDFLLFLEPGQALQVGRFMDKFMLSHISTFVEQLHVTFARKPTVLRKVIRAITTGLNSGNSAEVKARVLPHFRAHPRLVEMFRMLLPDERPPESVYETGTDHVTESFLVADKRYDVWEFSDEDKKRRRATPGLDTMYVNGRVFLCRGRAARPARVLFPHGAAAARAHARRLAPAHAHPPDDAPRNKTPPKRPRKQKSPTKKDVNDNTKKDLLSPKPKKQKTKNGKKEEMKIEIKTVKRKDSKKMEPKVKGNKQAASGEEKKEKENRSWTREEDKTMLQVLKGEAGSEAVFGRLRERLPHRSPADIRERFTHVMTLLHQMAGGDVT